MLQQLEFKASNAVRAALSYTGRTEDVRFSPYNRRLVLAGYGLNHLLRGDGRNSCSLIAGIVVLLLSATAGTPTGNRTPVCAVRGRRPNR